MSDRYASDALASSSDESHDALLDLYNRRFDIQIELAPTEEVIKSWGHSRVMPRS